MDKDIDKALENLNKAFGDIDLQEQKNIKFWNTVTEIGWWTSVAGIVILISFLIVNR